MATFNEKPNIIIIISDALRPKDLSLYGNKKELDTHIKKIASESVVFEKNLSTSNASDTSLTAIFSGLYPTSSGFIHQHPYTKKEEIDKLRKIKFWLPTFLKKQGYSTFSSTPLHSWFKKGFDASMSLGNKEANKFLNNQIIKKILLMLPNWAYAFGKKLVKARASPDFYSAEKVINLAISQISSAQKPFFLFMHLVDTHFPFPGTETKKTIGRESLKLILKNIKYSAQKEYIKKRFHDTSAEYLEQILEKRDEAIGQVDNQMGRLYNFLKSKKLWKNTIFIFLSDHGENYGEHGIYFCRGGLYDSSLHTPLIIHLPKIKPKRINQLTQSIDIAPTILEILGKNQKLDGKSMLNGINKNKKIRDKAILIDGFCEDRIAIRTETKKTITSREGKCRICGAEHGLLKEVYDLKKDPEELNNISKF